eukprot:TRINITY_DN738_c1_g2_i3.p2 TRINITY_DN738_c1_g2~~TRINITY_DN738_c1_g2_i3.p2  ORF type:complete len:164 (+),score=41.92 TRINITY_DN738_c1_g2_i3:940-1431(+)
MLLLDLIFLKGLGTLSEANTIQEEPVNTPSSPSNSIADLSQSPPSGRERRFSLSLGILQESTEEEQNEKKHSSPSLNSGQKVIRLKLKDKKLNPRKVPSAPPDFGRSVTTGPFRTTTTTTTKQSTSLSNHSDSSPRIAKSDSQEEIEAELKTENQNNNNNSNT